MIRHTLRFAALGAASLLVSSTASAQLGSVTYTPPAAPAAPAAPAMPAAPAATDAVVVPAGQAPVGAPVATAAPMALVAKAPDDMTGALGFGLGVKAGTQLITTTDVVGIKYWTSDSMALAPSFGLSYSKPKGVDATWSIRPELVLLFVPWKTTSTRFELGGGLGLGVGKVAPILPATSSDTSFEISIPIQAGVEHFFTRWFAMGIAARMNLFNFTKMGEVQSFSLAIDSTSYLGQLFFYTD